MVLYTARKQLIVASAKRLLLANTSATNVLVYTVRKTGLFSVQPYAVVENAATTLTLSMSWTDPDAGADTYDWATGGSQAVGTAVFSGLLICAQGGTTITVSATAGTANNITVSANIRNGE